MAVEVRMNLDLHEINEVTGHKIEAEITCFSSRELVNYLLFSKSQKQKF